MGTTLEHRLTGGETVRLGSEHPYRRLRVGRGERRLVRSPAGAGGSTDGTSGARSLCVLVHLTDLQLADVASPGRFEFFEYLRGLSNVGAFIPAQRPQEALAVHAVDAMARTIRSLEGSPDTGAPVDLAVCTGDNLDNAQLNELTWFLTLLAGGRLAPASGGLGYEGVQSAAFPGELYWHPDEPGDRWQARWGFPRCPGLLDDAAAPFEAGGLGVPWVSCFGNHDGLPFGEVLPTPAYAAAVAGRHKAVALPLGLDPIGREEELFGHPEVFLGGPGRDVGGAAGRSLITRRQFVEAHLHAPGLPSGHGFGEANVRNGTAYAAYDGLHGVRLLLLDSTNLSGRSDGSFGRRQLGWLEDRLVEVHARYRSRSGTTVPTGHEDRLVVLASHHGLASLTNDRELHESPEEDLPRATAGELVDLLERFPNVVLWLNGHRHRNDVQFRPGGAGTGLWEVSTAATADWPSQARLVELVANEDGTLSILCTMLDHGAAADPRAGDGAERLAAWHRELAANVPGRGLGSVAEGRPEDRNVELRLPAPFPLR